VEKRLFDSVSGILLIANPGLFLPAVLESYIQIDGKPGFQNSELFGVVITFSIW
jgi:hypothetical protein